jgi:hypothetical protein
VSPKLGGLEAQIIASQLSGFDYQRSPVWQRLQLQFSSGVRHRELETVALILCSLNNQLPVPTRSERRSFALMIRWFETYWAKLEPILPLVALRDEFDEVINLKREQQETMVKQRRN